MTSFFDNWRRHLWLWVLPLGFCVLNLLGIAFYHSSFAGQVERLERRNQAASNTLEQIKNERLLIEDFLARIEIHKEDVQGLHRDRFQTEEERFTEAYGEVKRLARQAGLRPSSFNYPRSPFPGHKLVQRNINFSVNGTYDQLRNFINFLELSDHFLTLNSVSLGGGGESSDPSLGIQLTVSTIFTTRKVEAPRAPQEEPSS